MAAAADQRPVEVEAAIMVGLPDGDRFAAVPRIDPGDRGDNMFGGRTYTLRAGDWSVRIEFEESVLEALGEEARGIITSSIDSTTRFGYPVVVLRPPFRWADDTEVPLQMQAVHSDFVVRRGCDEQAVACTGGRTLQVIPLDQVVSGGPVWDGRAIRIRRVEGRPVDDPAYLDPLLPAPTPSPTWCGPARR